MSCKLIKGTRKRVNNLRAFSTTVVYFTGLLVPFPTDQNTNTGSKIAFFAYLTHNEKNPSLHFPFVFDHVVTNIGDGYNNNTGAFTSPVSGTFVFMWNTRVYDGDIVTELVINSVPITATHVYANTNLAYNSYCGFAVIHVNANDVILVRKHSAHNGPGTIISDTFGKSSFAGWQLS